MEVGQCIRMSVVRSDASSDSDGELQGTVSGEKMPQRMSTNKLRKTTSRDESSTPCSDSVDLQNLLAKRLSDFIDSHYEIGVLTASTTTTTTTTTASSAASNTGLDTSKFVVRLFKESRSPLMVEEIKETRNKKHVRVNLSDDSSDSEEEKLKLKEACIDAQIILQQKIKRTKH